MSEINLVFVYLYSAEPVIETAKTHFIDANSMQVTLKYYGLFQLAFVLFCIFKSLVPTMTATRCSLKLNLKMKIIFTLVITVILTFITYKYFIMDSQTAIM